MDGVDTISARVTARHTPSTARNYCAYLAEYEGGAPSASPLDVEVCVRETMAKNESFSASADCSQRLLTDAFGNMYRYAGRQAYGSIQGEYNAWIKQGEREPIAPACSTNYAAVTEQFALLCPRSRSWLIPAP